MVFMCIAAIVCGGDMSNMSIETNIKADAEKDGIKRESDPEEDYVVKSIGGFGVWQAIVTIMIATTRIMPLWNIQSILFLTPPTEFSCIRFKGNSTVPEVMMSTCYDSCEEYKYSQDVFEETLISQFGLICENAWMASFIQTVMMFGLLVGIFVFGWISDRFGRSISMLISGFLCIFFMFIVPFCSNFWIFTSLRFFIGLASSGIVTVSSVMVMEIVGPKFRYEIGCIALIPDGIAESTLALFAYYTSSWSKYLFFYTVVSVPILVLILCIPETPRWLMANGNSDKTIVLMTKAAKMNNLKVEGIKETIYTSRESMKVADSPQDKMPYLDLFRTKELAIMTTCSVIVWFVGGFSFFGLNQYISMIGKNIYVVVAILGGIQILACPLTVLISTFCGRKSSAIISSIIVSVTMASLIFIPNGTWTSTILGIIGTTAANTGFVVINIYVTELYPTTMRNMGFSFSLSASKLGAMLAPFVANLRPPWIAALIFAILPFVAIVFCCFLPETKGKRLKDSLE